MKFKLHADTLFLTIQLIDRFLSVRPCPRSKLQLVGVVAMLMASKVFEGIYESSWMQFSFLADDIVIFIFFAVCPVLSLTLRCTD